MTVAVFIDTNIPVYAVGREHRYRASCLRILGTVAENRHAFVTNSEVMQEIIHYYINSRRWAEGQMVLNRFTESMHDRIEPVYANDVLLAAEMVDLYQDMDARDLIHVAVMRRLGISRIITADKDFDRIDDIQRLDPLELDQWENSMLDVK